MNNIINALKNIVHRREPWNPIPGILVYIPTSPDMPYQPPSPQTTYVIAENEDAWAGFTMDLFYLGNEVHRTHRHRVVMREPTGVLSEYLYVPLESIENLRGSHLTRVILYNVALSPEQHYRLKAGFRENPFNVFTIIN